MIDRESMNSLEIDTRHTRCGRCTNNCLLTINNFTGGRRFITGNRCEKGLGKEKSEHEVPNLFEYKMHRLFDYDSLSEEKV